MTTVEKHYADHLAPVYVWMAGGIDDALARGAAEIDIVCPAGQTGSTAVDLGAGFGMHAIPLAARGYRVTAIDSSPLLLDVLSKHAADLPVDVVCGDLLEFGEQLAGQVDLILCMGDTLTHIENTDSVGRLFDSCRRWLRQNGRLVLTFRDYSRELTAENRFIEVRSDATRILTCFLEYSANAVTVHDMLHEYSDSAWKFSVSAYRKLRLSPQSVVKSLESRAFDVRVEPGIGGMVRVIATREGQR